MSDHNLASFADHYDLLIEDRVFLPPAGEHIEDSLKCSSLTRSTFRRCVSFGGLENALDCNRLCRDLRFESCSFFNGEQAAIVIKGGCERITFTGCLLCRAEKSWCDVLLDDWSDQSRQPSREIDLRGLHRTDGAKVRIVVGRGWGRILPSYNPAHAEILFVKSVGVHLYNLVKGLCCR